MARIVVKLRQNAFQTIPAESVFGEKKIVFDKNFRRRTSFLTIWGQFWRIYRQTDLKIKSLALFRSRWTYSEVCTTKARRKYVRRRPGIPDAPTPTPPELDPPSAFT